MMTSSWLLEHSRTRAMLRPPRVHPVRAVRQRSRATPHCVLRCTGAGRIGVEAARLAPVLEVSMPSNLIT